MPTGPEHFDQRTLDFLADRHLATLATLRADGTPHVVAVGFTWEPETGLARVITNAGSQKTRNIVRAGRAALTQIDGPRWLTLEGPARVTDHPDDVARAERLYARRYRTPRISRIIGLVTASIKNPAAIDTSPSTVQ